MARVLALAKTDFEDTAATKGSGSITDNTRRDIAVARNRHCLESKGGKRARCDRGTIQSRYVDALLSSLGKNQGRIAIEAEAVEGGIEIRLTRKRGVRESSHRSRTFLQRETAFLTDIPRS